MPETKTILAIKDSEAEANRFADELATDLQIGKYQIIAVEGPQAANNWRPGWYVTAE